MKADVEEPLVCERAASEPRAGARMKAATDELPTAGRAALLVSLLCLALVAGWCGDVKFWVRRLPNHPRWRAAPPGVPKSMWPHNQLLSNCNPSGRWMSRGWTTWIVWHHEEAVSKRPPRCCIGTQTAEVLMLSRSTQAKPLLRSTPRHRTERQRRHRGTLRPVLGRPLSHDHSEPQSWPKSKISCSESSDSTGRAGQRHSISSWLRETLRDCTTLTTRRRRVSYCEPTTHRIRCFGHRTAALGCGRYLRPS